MTTTAPIRQPDAATPAPKPSLARKGCAVVIALWRRVRRENARWQVEHYKALDERHHKETLFYQAQLYSAWKTMWGQTKGLQRQARKIKRLEARIKELSSPNP